MWKSNISKILLLTIIYVIENFDKWPKRNYMLIGTENGPCPEGFAEESDYVLFDRPSSLIEIQNNYLKTELKDKILTFRTCKITGTDEATEWSKGKYCTIIDSASTCPTSFKKVTIKTGGKKLYLFFILVLIKEAAKVSIPASGSTETQNNINSDGKNTVPSGTGTSSSQSDGSVGKGGQSDTEVMDGQSSTGGKDTSSNTVLKTSQNSLAEGSPSPPTGPINGIDIKVQPQAGQTKLIAGEKSNPIEGRDNAQSETAPIQLSRQTLIAKQTAPETPPKAGETEATKLIVNKLISTFCCINEEMNEKNLTFPKQSSFVLIKLGDKCPVVEGLFHKEFSYNFYPEDGVSFTQTTDSNDNTLPNIITTINTTSHQFKFCYYSLNDPAAGMSTTMKMSLAITTAVITLIIIAVIIYIVMSSGK